MVMDDNVWGLLDSPEGQGLLAAVATGLAGARRGRPLNSLGAAGVGGLLAYNQAQQNQAEAAKDMQRSKFFDMQIQQMQEQQARQKAAQEALQRRKNYLGSVGKVTSPRVDAQPNQFDPMAWISMDGSPEEAKILAGSKDWGASEVARTIEGVDGQGNKVTYQYDKFGRPVGGGVQAYTAPVQVDTGGKVVFVRPQAGVSLSKTMTPDAVASNAVARGNLAVAQQRLAYDMSGKPEYKDGQWVVPPRDMKPGEARQVAGNTQQKDANDALALIQQARSILPGATGSYAGAAWNQANRLFGNATEGDKASARLKALSGALVAKMPKMSGPQSDKDLALYREMAGRVGDETLPVELRQAALDTVEAIQARYASGQSVGSDLQAAAAAELARRRKGK